VVDVAPPELPKTSWTTRLVLLGLVAMAVGALSLTGGLDPVSQPPPAPLPTVAVSQAVDAGPWQASVTNAVAVSALGSFKPKTEGNWLLAVAVRIEVTGPDSLRAWSLDQIARLPELAGLVDDRAPDRRTGGAEPAAVFLNPGLPERVAFIFEVTAGTPVPKDVAVALNGYTAQMSWTTRRLVWDDFGEQARVVVPVDNQVDTP
jgi:hypothetical protein